MVVAPVAKSLERNCALLSAVLAQCVHRSESQLQVIRSEDRLQGSHRRFALRPRQRCDRMVPYQTRCAQLTPGKIGFRLLCHQFAKQRH